MIHILYKEAFIKPYQFKTLSILIYTSSQLTLFFPIYLTMKHYDN